MPSIILGIFLYQTFDVEEYQDRLSCLAVCLLTYIAIMEDMRKELPDIPSMTVADWFMFFYITLSMFPILDHIIGKNLCEQYEGHENEEEECDKSKKLTRFCLKNIVLGLNAISWFVLAYKYFTSRNKLNQLPPEQVKASGSKAAVDIYWKPL